MKRIKLEMPEKFEFSTKIPVRITDINYGNHLGNDSILSLIHEARIQYLNKINLKELNDDRTGIIMVDSVVLYKSEILYGDVLTFNISVNEISESGCDFYYQILSEKNAGPAALAKTSIVYYDYKKKKITALPEIYIESIKRLKSG